MKLLRYDQGTFLHCHDFECQVLEPTIAKVQTDLVCYEGKFRPRSVIYFEETEKVLLLSKYIASGITRFHGSQTDNWKGKEIVLTDHTPFEAVDLVVVQDEIHLMYAWQMQNGISYD